MATQLKASTEMFHGTVTVVKAAPGDYLISAAIGRGVTPTKRWAKEIVQGLLKDCGEEVIASFLKFVDSREKRWEHRVSVPVAALQKRAIEPLGAEALSKVS